MYRLTRMCILAYRSKFPINTNEYRFTISEPLHALTDIDYYKNLQYTNPVLREITDNLIYHVSNSENKRFQTLAYDLDLLGFVARPSTRINQEDLEEQLKLLNQCTRLLYLN